MGYTRYYEVKQKLDEQKFERFSEDCKIVCQEICKIYNIELGDWRGVEKEPQFTPDVVCFNGYKDESCETFILTKKTNGFEFTKTNRKNYDKCVLACLLLAKDYFGESIRVSSDGDNDDENVKSTLASLRRENKINSILS